MAIAFEFIVLVLTTRLGPLYLHYCPLRFSPRLQRILFDVVPTPPVAPTLAL